MNEWYKTHLGFDTTPYGSSFEWRELEDSSKKGLTQWNPFSETTTYFEPSTKDFMINYRVENLEALVEELKKEGFGVLTDIDVQATLKKKLDVNFRKYRILGACNPPFAYKALQAENKIGTMLPCNVIVQELDDGKTEVAAVDPVASMQAVENEKLGEIANEIRSRLEKVIKNI